MKKIILISFILTCSIYSFAQNQKGFSLYLDAGIPTQKNMNWGKLNLSVNVGLDYNFNKWAIAGIGFNFNNINFNQEVQSSDKMIYDIYLKGGAHIYVTKGLKFMLNLRAGFAIVENSYMDYRNNPANFRQYGISCTPEIIISQRIYQGLNIFAAYSINTIFPITKHAKETEGSIGIIPAPLSPIHLFAVKLGISYNFF